MDDLLRSKIICIFVFLVVASLGCLVPHALTLLNGKCKHSEDKIKNILEHLNCFGAGFIFSIIIFHLLPETIMTVVSHTEMTVFNSDDADTKLLYIFLFIFLGFSIQLALEYVCPIDKHICCVLHENNNVCNEENVTSCNFVKSSDDCVPIELEHTILGDNKIPESLDNPKFAQKTFLQFIQAFTVQSFFLTISLAIHSIIEGMVVGTSDRANYVYVNSFCILAHKWIAAITVSISLKQNELSKCMKNILLVFFIISSPVGIILGILAQSAGSKVTSLINAGSMGTLLLIGCEILLNEINEKFSRKVRFTKWICFCCSCTVTFAIIFISLRLSPHVH